MQVFGSGFAGEISGLIDQVAQEQKVIQVLFG